MHSISPREMQDTKEELIRADWSVYWLARTSLELLILLAELDRIADSYWLIPPAMCRHEIMRKCVKALSPG